MHATRGRQFGERQHTGKRYIIATPSNKSPVCILTAHLSCMFYLSGRVFHPHLLISSSMNQSLPYVGDWIDVQVGSELLQLSCQAHALAECAAQGNISSSRLSMSMCMCMFSRVSLLYTGMLTQCTVQATFIDSPVLRGPSAGREHVITTDHDSMSMCMSSRPHLNAHTGYR
eukprot:scpid96415/ scgid21560/ 